MSFYLRVVQRAARLPLAACEQILDRLSSSLIATISVRMKLKRELQVYLQSYSVVVSLIS